MLRDLFRNIGGGAVGRGSKESRMPKSAVNPIPPVRKGFGKRALTTPLAKKPAKA
jgi:hypothetical protein